MNKPVKGSIAYNITESLGHIAILLSDYEKQENLISKQFDRINCMREFIENNGLREQFEEDHGHALDESCTCNNSVESQDSK